MKVNSGTMNAVNLEEFVDIGLSTTLTFLVVARKDRRAGNVTAASREELGAHRAYQEALHLFRVLRPRICQTGARRLAIRIKEIGNAMRRLAPPVLRLGRPALLAVANPQQASHGPSQCRFRLAGGDDDGKELYRRGRSRKKGGGSK